jgi:hypothetical protein
MTLTLDHNQRINLGFLLGLQECRTVNDTRAAWKLMDRLALEEDEKQAIEFVAQIVNGNEAFTWNPTKTLPVREYELSDAELRQIQGALNLPSSRFLPGVMRRWLEPLLAQLPEPVESNGNR